MVGKWNYKRLTARLDPIPPVNPQSSDSTPWQSGCTLTCVALTCGSQSLQAMISSAVFCDPNLATISDLVNQRRHPYVLFRFFVSTGSRNRSGSRPHSNWSIAPAVAEGGCDLEMPPLQLLVFLLVCSDLTTWRSRPISTLWSCKCQWGIKSALISSVLDSYLLDCTQLG